MRTRSEVEDMVAEAGIRATQGTRFPGMSYEEGVDSALRWALGIEDELPIQDSDGVYEEEKIDG